MSESASQTYFSGMRACRAQCWTAQGLTTGVRRCGDREALVGLPDPSSAPPTGHLALKSASGIGGTSMVGISSIRSSGALADSSRVKPPTWQGGLRSHSAFILL